MSADTAAAVAPPPRFRFVAAPWWTAAAVSAISLALTAWFVHRCKLANGGQFVYPLDDAYGHMAIAKNLAQHRLWGFSAIDGFSSGSSSLLWPLLLAACFRVFGVHEWPPLALNLVAAVGFVFYAGAVIRRETRSGAVAFVLLAAVMFLTPLLTVAECGMEHCWQILICLWFLDLAVKRLADDVPPQTARHAGWLLPVASFGMTLVRYEGLFLLGLVGLLLLCRRRWWLTAACAAAGGLPVAAFGVYAMSRGWRFLPNSVLLKAGVLPPRLWDAFLAFVTKIHADMTANPHMVALVAGLTAALLAQGRRRDTLWHRQTLRLTLLLGGTLMHLQFAGAGWIFRYEGYLLGLGILFIGLTVAEEIGDILADGRGWLERGQRLGVWVVAGFLFVSPLWSHAAKAWAMMVPASHNIYEQQYQMAHFLRQSYRNEGVAANDIGAIDFFANIGLVDLWGLGTMEVAQAKFDHRYTPDVVRRLIARHDVRVIMVYLEWASSYGGPLPEWVPVGRWTIPDNEVCGSATVAFFAPNPTLVPTLAGALREYAPRLPPGIVQTGYYRGEPLPHVQGTFGPERDDRGVFYWTRDAAQFVLRPSDERADAAGVDSTLVLNVRTPGKGVTLDLTFNGQAVASRRVEDGEAGAWMDWRVKVRWREGDNFVNVAARGGQPLVTPGDSRELRLAVHEPRWTFDDRPDEPHPPSPPAAP